MLFLTGLLIIEIRKNAPRTLVLHQSFRFIFIEYSLSLAPGWTASATSYSFNLHLALYQAGQPPQGLQHWPLHLQPGACARQHWPRPQNSRVGGL